MGIRDMAQTGNLMCSFTESMVLPDIKSSLKES